MQNAEDAQGVLNLLDYFAVFFLAWFPSLSSVLSVPRCRRRPRAVDMMDTFRLMQTVQSIERPKLAQRPSQLEASYNANADGKSQAVGELFKQRSCQSVQ